MNKKLYVRIYRFLLNMMPCVWGGGGKVVLLSEDFTHLRVRLPFNFRTRNAVGTIYGGSLYASTDPMFMIMLTQILGKDYVVWDKGCTIRFRRPARKTVFCDFVITPEMVAEVKTAVAKDQRTTFTWKVAYKDEAGVVYTEFDKVLYVATKEFYKNKTILRR